MSPAARGWFFGTQYHPYMARPEWGSVRNVFWSFETTSFQFWRNMAWAFFAAIYSTRLGLAFAQGEAIDKPGLRSILHGVEEHACGDA